MHWYPGIRSCHSAALTLVAVGVSVASHLGAQQSGNATQFDVPPWAFPKTTPGMPTAKPPFDTVQRLHVPNSPQTFTLAQTKDALNPPDWFPSSHKPAPDVVIHARKEMKYACGLCHLPDGQGRSENATIVGLPVPYFLAQLNDMKAGTRKAATGDFNPSNVMRDVAVGLTDDEAKAAAQYFAKMRAKPRYTVVEGERVPGTYQAGGLLALKPGADSEPLGTRLLEVSDDIERHELRDPNETFTTYVPPGSIARGKVIATTGPKKGVTHCTTCHGDDLRGIGLVPPIAGRSPAYLLRQLLGFKTGTRLSATSTPMVTATAQLSLDDMIAAVAYAGSRKP